MKIGRDFYMRDALSLAPDLLGTILVHVTEEGITRGRIVETEAYMGTKDPASHSYKGNTHRTAVMFGPGGYAYLYLIYGIHCCMNVVANQPGIPEAVLIRAIEPLDGIALMERRRNTTNLYNLTSGPGKLCQAMGLGKENYGADLLGDTLFLEYGDSTPFSIVTAPRVNVDYAGEAALYPWRFCVADSPFLSLPPNSGTKCHKAVKKMLK